MTYEFIDTVEVRTGGTEGEFAQATGALGLIGGEAADIEATRNMLAACAVNFPPFEPV